MKIKKPFDEITLQDVNDFIELNDKRETLFLEFKLTNKYLLKKTKSYCKDHEIEDQCEYEKNKDDIPTDISAFLNAYGGYLIYGIDNGGNIAGMKKDNFKNKNNITEELNKILFNIISKKIIPNVNGIRGKHIEIPNKDRFIYLIYIPEGHQKWYIGIKNEYPVHVSRTDNGRLIMDRDTIKYGYISTEYAEKQIDDFIQNKLELNGYYSTIIKSMKEEVVIERSRFIIYCIPTDFRSIILDINEYPENEDLAKKFRNPYSEGIRDYFEIDNYHLQTSSTRGNLQIDLRCYINGIVECSILISGLEESKPFSLEDLLLESLRYTQPFTRKVLHYIVTLRLLVKKGDKINKFPLRRHGIIKEFAKPLIDLAEIEFGINSMESIQKTNLKILYNQLLYFKNLKGI